MSMDASSPHADNRFNFDVASHVKSYNEFIDKYEIASKPFCAKGFGVYYTKSIKYKSPTYVTKIVKYDTAQQLQEIIQQKVITENISLCNKYDLLIHHQLFKGLSDNEIYITLPLLQCTLTHAVMKKNIFSLNKDRLTHFILDITSDLDKLHSSYYAHLDISPSNIMYNQYKKRWTLIDYENMEFVNPKIKQYKYTQTVTWGPPEMFPDPSYKKPNIITNSSDIWSFGLCIVFVLTKNHLFDLSDKDRKKCKNDRKALIKCFYNKYYQPFLKNKGNKSNKLNYKDGDLMIKGHLERLESKNIIDNNFCDLLKRMLTFDPNKRITAKEILRHKLFRKCSYLKSFQSKSGYLEKLNSYSKDP